MERNIVKLQGFPVDTFSQEEALQYASQYSGQIITINPEIIAYAKKNPEFAQIIHKAELIIPDGIGIEIGLKILGHTVKRIAGIDFTYKLIDIFTLQNKKIALVGAKPEVLQKTVKNLKNRNPKINLVLVQDGYFEDEEMVFANIELAQPDLILTALGAPKQELFNRRIKDILPNALSVGVGGSFDVWSGMVKRAPLIWQKLGLEWLYRTINEPKRFKRIFPTLPLFVLSVLSERIFKEDE